MIFARKNLVRITSDRYQKFNIILLFLKLVNLQLHKRQRARRFSRYSVKIHRVWIRWIQSDLVMRWMGILFTKWVFALLWHTFALKLNLSSPMSIPISEYNPVSTKTAIKYNRIPCWKLMETGHRFIRIFYYSHYNLENSLTEIHHFAAR